MARAKAAESKRLASEAAEADRLAQEAADNAEAARLARDPREEARQVFQDADKDKNGFLTKSEIRKYFKKNPAQKNRILGSDFEWKDFFTDMDKNGDKKFDLNEFTHFVSRAYKLANTKKEEAAKANAVRKLSKGARKRSSSISKPTTTKASKDAGIHLLT